MWLARLWHWLWVWVFGFLSASFFVIGGLIVLDQCAQWAKTAAWEPLTIAQVLPGWGLSRPDTPNYRSLQKIVDALLMWPASVGYLLVGGLFALPWYRVMKKLHAIEMKELERKYWGPIDRSDKQERLERAR